MAKASLELPNGTTVVIEGSKEEIRELLEFYGVESRGRKIGAKGKRAETKGKKAKGGAKAEEVDLAEVVNLVKNCDEAEVIESEILDRTSQVNRVLLPLYIVHEYKANRFGLTTGQVAKVTRDLGIPMLVQNVARTFSGCAKGYVMGDKVRKRGQAVRYKLSRRGVTYLKGVLEGAGSGK